MVRNENNKMHAVKRRKAREIGQFLRRNCHLEDTIERKKEREDEEEDVSSYWMILRKGEYTGI
jgi:hypothetical protein